MYIYIFEAHHRPDEMSLTGIFVVTAVDFVQAQQLVNEYPTRCDWRPVLYWFSIDIPFETVSDKRKVPFVLVQRFTVNTALSRVITCKGNIFDHDGDYLHA